MAIGEGSPGCNGVSSENNTLIINLDTPIQYVAVELGKLAQLFLSVYLIFLMDHSPSAAFKRSLYYQG